MVLIQCDLCGKVVNYCDSFNVDVTTQTLLKEDDMSGEYKGGCDVCLLCAEKIAGKILRVKDDAAETKASGNDVAFAFYLINRKGKGKDE